MRKSAFFRAALAGCALGALAVPARALQYPLARFGGLTLDVPLAVASGGLGNAAGDASALTALAPGGSVALSLAARFGFELRPEDFGAVGNGVADDTAAVQSWLNVLIAAGGEGVCRGVYRLTSGVNGFAASTPYRLHGGVMEACKFYIDFNGWGSAAFDLTNPVSPTSSNRGQPVEVDHIGFTYHSTLTAPPVAFRARYATNLYLHDVNISQFTQTLGTALQISGAWNSHIREVQVWGAGGFRTNHLINAAAAFSITAASTTLTASQSEFVASDVGSSITVAGTSNGNYEQFLISGYTSGTSVTVSRAASFTHTAQPAAFSGLMGSISAASNVLTVSNARLTSSDIGRVVYVAGAGAPYQGTPPLRATITGVSGTSITLSAAAATTVSNVEIIIDPAVELFQDADSSGTTNDFSSLNLHLEENSGVSLVAQSCGFCTFHRTKIEIDLTNPPWGTNDKNGQAQAAFFGGGDLDGIVNGSAVSAVGQIWVQNQGGTFTIGEIQGGATTGQPAISFANNNSNSLMSIGDRMIGNLVAASWLPYLYYTDGSSTFGATTIGNIVAYGSGQASTIKSGGLTIGAPPVLISSVNIMAPSGTAGGLSIQAPSSGSSCLRIFQPGSTSANGTQCFNSSGFNINWPLMPNGSTLTLGSSGNPWNGVYANVYYAGATAGVSCSGAPSGSFAVSNGIVTHC